MRQVLAAVHPPLTYRLLERWRGLSLARQFALASFAILLTGMVTTAIWVANRIEAGVVNNSGVAVALFVDSFIAPMVQELNESDRLSADSLSQLDTLLNDTPLGSRVLSFKIWLEGGYVVFSSNEKAIGVTYPVTPNLRDALNGHIHADFDDLEDVEDMHERKAGLPLLEIYSPIRSEVDGQVFAVVEFYTLAEELEAELFRSKLETWLLSGIAGMLMFLALSGIALRGSRTIDSQQRRLKARVSDLSVLSDRLEKASRRTTELNEQYLRRVGADLHDGPCQLIALVLLKLDKLEKDLRVPRHTEACEKELDIVRDALNESLTDLRNISAGLAMPQIEGLTLEQMLSSLAQAHERRTGMKVDRRFSHGGAGVPHSILFCLYRFVQEVLFNAYYHGKARRATVRTECRENTLFVHVIDQGDGFDVDSVVDGAGLGLPGLRQRIESIGGFFEIRSEAGKGTHATARFFLAVAEAR